MKVEVIVMLCECFVNHSDVMWRLKCWLTSVMTSYASSTYTFSIMTASSVSATLYWLNTLLITRFTAFTFLLHISLSVCLLNFSYSPFLRSRSRFWSPGDLLLTVINSVCMCVCLQCKSKKSPLRFCANFSKTVGYVLTEFRVPITRFYLRYTTNFYSITCNFDKVMPYQAYHYTTEPPSVTTVVVCS